MNLLFKRIKVKNFLSLGSVELDLDKQGLVSVRGLNNSPGSLSSNGAGKSSLFEAIYYALTGKTLRNTSEVLNRYVIEDKCVSVELEFNLDNTNYVVNRVRGHKEFGNNLKIIKNGIDISGDKLRKSESILASELGLINSTLLSSIIILGQGLPNRFTSLSPAGRKDRLEELSQSSSFLDEFIDRVSKSHRKYSDLVSSLRSDIDKATASVGMLKDRIKEQSISLEKLLTSDSSVDQMTSDLEVLKLRKSEVEDKISSSTTTLSSLNESRSSYNTSLTKLTEFKSKLSYEYKSLSHELNSYSSNKQCPTCGQTIGDPDLIKSKSDELRSKIDIIVAKGKDAATKIDSIASNISLIDTNIKEASSILSSCTEELSSINQEIRELEVSIKFQSENVQKIEDEIASANLQISEITQLSTDKGVELSECCTKLGILDYFKKISSREFRGYLLKGIIEYLNTKLQKYGLMLFDTDSLHMILDGNNLELSYDGRPYENLSGGERHRFDLAVQFSLRDLMSSSLGLTSNLLVIDEGFDNLDESGVLALINVLNSFSDLESVYSISHHTMSVPFDRELLVVKGVDNISSVKESTM